MSDSLKDGERIVRHSNGHLMVERFDPVPSEAETDKAFKSLAKAWPVLAEHASHIDGEFDNALTDMRSCVRRLRSALSAARSELDETLAAGIIRALRKENAELRAALSAASRPPSTDGPQA